MTEKEIIKKIQKLLDLGDELNEKLLDEIQEKIRRLYLNSLQDIQLQIAEIFKKLGDNLTFSEVYKYGRLDKLEKFITDRLDQTSQDTIKTIEKSTNEIFIQSYSYVGFVTESTLQAEIGFPYLSKEEVKAIIVNPLDRIKWQDRETLNKEFLTNRIKQYLANAFNDGLGYSKIAKEFDEIYDIGYHKSKTIFRTEGHKITQLGRSVGFDRFENYAVKNNIDLQRYWNATLDSKTRPNHGRMEDVKPNKDKMFRFVTMKGDVKLVAGPGMTNSTDDINCRCTLSIRINEVPPKYRRDGETKKVIPYETYSKWRAKRFKSPKSKSG